ncbi:protein UXT homolog [Euwallacea fornicatus]|uniref:protein UXT homolog n=1 Tax=Euwallacea fornicatus TaxID=995702 RepID=UPI0033905EB5
MEIPKKLQEYENFIEEKLKPDLREIETTLSLKSNQSKEWTELKNILTVLREFKEKDQDMNVQFNMGHEIASFAKICDYETVYVDVGLGYLLEMDCDEANKYADIRLNLLQKEINHLRQLAVNVKVHVKLALLAIGELQNSLLDKFKR